MAVNKVIYDGDTLVDLTGDSVTPQTLAMGETAHAANGEPITGLLPVVSITNVTESNDDGGSNTVTFSDGTQLNIKNGNKGSEGDIGFYIKATVDRPSFTEANWTTYGEIGHSENWGNTDNTGFRDGDLFIIAGTSTDAGKGHMLIYRFYKDTSSRKTLYGECIGHHIISAKGADGTDGVTPVKGVDYFTEAEKENMKNEVAQEVIAAFNGLPLFGVVGENNVVTITSLLSDGTYTLKYENSDGSTTEIGSITVDGSNSGDSTGPTVTEVDVASIGYTDSARWSTSDGTIRTGATGNTAINLVEFERASGQTMTIHLSGITWTGGATVTAILFFTNGTYGGTSHYIPLDAAHNYMDVLGGRTVFNDDGSIDVILTDHPSGTLYNGFKVCGTGSGANATISYTVE